MSFTLPELRALAIEKADAGVAGRTSEGDARDFIRKRKRAFHRAIKRGDIHLSVVKFHTDIFMKKLLNESIKEMYSHQMVSDISAPMSGLMAWLPD